MAFHVDPAALVTGDISWQVACQPELHNAVGERGPVAATRQAVAHIRGVPPRGGNDDAIESFLKRQTRETVSFLKRQTHETVRSIVISCRALRNHELTLGDVLEIVEQCAISHCA